MAPKRSRSDRDSGSGSDSDANTTPATKRVERATKRVERQRRRDELEAAQALRELLGEPTEVGKVKKGLVWAGAAPAELLAALSVDALEELVGSPRQPRRGMPSTRPGLRVPT
jgi:hypothetical protein